MPFSGSIGSKDDASSNGYGSRSATMNSINIRKTALEVSRTAEQRKADNREFYSSNLKKLSEEGSAAGSVIDASCVGTDDGYYAFEEKEYHQVKFDSLMIGRESADDESSFLTISGIRFLYCDFSACEFSNIRFYGCFFVGCSFNECYTTGLGAVFKDCCFMRTAPGKSSIDDMPSIFTGCELTVKFVDCDLTKVVAEKTNFYFSSFENTNAFDMIFMNCSLDTVNMCDCDLRAAKLVNSRFIEFNLEDDKKKTKVNKKTFLGSINFNRREEREIRFAVGVYSTFSELFELNRVSYLSGEYFYQSKKTEHLSLKGFEKLKSFFGLITCGYGERPSFSLLTSLFIIFVCGILYLAFGVAGGSGVVAYRPTLGNILPAYNDVLLCFHFSLVTFSTVGYGNVTPVGGSFYVTAVEIISGVIMVGIWVSTLVRKMVR